MTELHHTVPGDPLNPYVQQPELDAWYRRTYERHVKESLDEAREEARRLYEGGPEQVIERAAVTIAKGKQPCLSCGAQAKRGKEHCRAHLPRSER